MDSRSPINNAGALSLGAVSPGMSDRDRHIPVRIKTVEAIDVNTLTNYHSRLILMFRASQFKNNSEIIDIITWLGKTVR